MTNEKNNRLGETPKADKKLHTRKSNGNRTARQYNTARFENICAVYGRFLSRPSVADAGAAASLTLAYYLGAGDE
ncbi:MAG: hypothetical protein H6948_05365 [Zoogloeaceae bacterium]|nr:hypothetical protein [Zoogloeaceae bacterium]